MRYIELGFKDFDSYFSYFLSTLLPSNKTYSYFVDWNKVRDNVYRYSKELSLLNSIRRSDNPVEELKSIISRFPFVSTVIPLLIAERIVSGKIDVLDDETLDFMTFDFHKYSYTSEEIELISTFASKTGIIDLINSTHDLIDYMLGVEVGLDTNARKNRSGTIFESMIGKLLEKRLEGFGIHYQSNMVSLYKTRSGRKINVHDFIITKDGKPIAIIETNFYNTPGSKPETIATDYISMSKEADKQGMKFVWITDGPAWLKMKSRLRKAMEEIDYVLNYRIAKDKINDVIKLN